MHKIYFYIILGLISISLGCRQEQNTIISGTILNSQDSIISISFGADPLTGQYPTGYQKDYVINDNGSFSIPIEIKPPINVVIFYNGFRSRIDLILLDKGEVIISVDGNNLRETLKFEGSNGDLNSFYFKWDKFYSNALKIIQKNIDSYSLYENGLDSLQKISFAMLSNYNSGDILSEDEVLWMKSELNYRKYLRLLFRAYELKSHPNDSAFQFFQAVNLNDNGACLINCTYNTLIQRYVLNELNSRGIFHSDFDDNNQFYQQYYEIIIEKLTGHVKDVMLTWFVSDLLKSYDGSAGEIYEKYIDDCDSPDMIEKTSSIYEDYKKIVNMDLSEKVIIIPTNNQSLEKVLNQFRNKVVYLDFWASWCSPCIEAMPKTKELAKFYEHKNLAVLYIGNKDQRSNLINAINKHNLDGYHILLNDKESELWRNEFNVSMIPTYVLINKAGEVIDKNASHPDEKDIYSQIEKLLLE
jgi:thiol-disulfide isomerase/thioredoxin